MAKIKRTKSGMEKKPHLIRVNTRSKICKSKSSNEYCILPEERVSVVTKQKQ